MINQSSSHKLTAAVTGSLTQGLVAAVRAGSSPAVAAGHGGLRAHTSRRAASGAGK